MTKAEEILWRVLKAKQFDGFKFRRQHGIGPYIADFCVPRKSLVIEIDGDIHANPEQEKYDKIRQRELELIGYRVIRYTNKDVFENLTKVLEDILSQLKTSPQPPPL